MDEKTNKKLIDDGWDDITIVSIGRMINRWNKLNTSEYILENDFIKTLNELEKLSSPTKERF